MHSLPEVIFSNGSASIVQGSVVWLFCVIYSTSPTLTLSWSYPQDPNIGIPHVRMRKYTSDANKTTLLLVVDSFQSYDNGNYQCTAENMGSVVIGTSSSLTGMLRIVFIKMHSIICI